ncbi:hypothetical protein Agabi119p4_2312 [Agaricus bisporus var. burnettii]|uniref:Uncharacterized protein n=1 Tax=Agaricus bisporus var. burnettii TaxID=192524 RepID=A0A8H7F8V0_AGABI|nr:hypothetical protein Agabi119p4_2312 [Agaricus bisporus var. burnettii]
MFIHVKNRAVFAWCNQEGIRLTIYAWHAFGNMTSRPCGPSNYPAPRGLNLSSSLAQQCSLVKDGHGT